MIVWQWYQTNVTHLYLLLYYNYTCLGVFLRISATSSLVTQSVHNLTSHQRYRLETKNLWNWSDNKTISGLLLVCGQSRGGSRSTEPSNPVKCWSTSSCWGNYKFWSFSAASNRATLICKFPHTENRHFCWLIHSIFPNFWESSNAINWPM